MLVTLQGCYRLTVEGSLCSIESECLDGSAVSKMFYSDVCRKHAFYDAAVEIGRSLLQETEKLSNLKVLGLYFKRLTFKADSPLLGWLNNSLLFYQKLI